MDAYPKTLSEAAENQKLLSVILEELGISDKVKVLANRLVKQIVSEYEPGYTLKVTPFSEKCGEYTISFNLVDKPRKPASGFKGITFFTRHEIRIEGYTVKGKIPADELADVLQHELKHVFDLYKSGRGGFFKDGKTQQIYIIGATQATDKSLPDEQRAIGYAIYLSHDFEGQAFESGTYAYLMKQDLAFMGDEVEAVKKTMYYERLMFVRRAYDFIWSNEEKAEEIAESIYGKNLNWLKRTVARSLKMTRRQIGRAVAKVRKDYDWTHGGNSTVWA